MNGLLPISSICLDSDLILRRATENPTVTCDVKQHCVFSLQCYILTSWSTVNASYVT